MNKKLKTIIISLLITPFILTSCGTKVSSNSEDSNFKYMNLSHKKNNSEINQLIQDINNSRKEIYSNTPTIKDEYINWFKNGEDEFTEKEIEEAVAYEKLHRNGKVIKSPESTYDEKKILTYEEAKEDIDYLFRLLRYSYGPYAYMGGDEIFNNAKTTIISEIEGKDTIKCYDFTNILRKNLTFIKDAHFGMSHNNIEVNNDYDGQVYYVGKEEFFKDSKGYYKLVEKKKYYANEINKDKDIEKYIKMSINAEGKLVYNVAILREWSRNSLMSIPVSYIKGQDIIEESIDLSMLSLKYRNKFDPFEYRIENNIPIAKIGAMHDVTPGSSAQDNFVNTAKEMKEYPISIVDLRGNTGGFSTAGLNWTVEYTGSGYGVYGAFAQVDSKMTREIQTQVVGKMPQFPFSTIQREAKISERVENDKLLFILIDKYVGSATEIFLENLINVDNVVLVGTNTMGCRISNIFNYKLNNSNIEVSFGDKLYLTPYGEDFEYKGFQPDILVESDKALDRLLKMIEYYGISENNKKK